MTEIDAKGSRIRDAVRDSNILWDISSKLHWDFDSAASGMSRGLCEVRHHRKQNTYRVERVLPRRPPAWVCEGHNKWNQQYECDLGERKRKYYRSILPTFDGTSISDDFRDWSVAIENYFEKMQFPERLQCKVASYTLIGEAESWWKWLKYDRCLEGKSKISSWIRMKHLLARRFMNSWCSTKCPAEDYISTWSENRKPETTNGFYHATSVSDVKTAPEITVCSKKIEEQWKSRLDAICSKELVVVRDADCSPKLIENEEGNQDMLLEQEPQCKPLSQFIVQSKSETKEFSEKKICESNVEFIADGMLNPVNVGKIFGRLGQKRLNEVTTSVQNDDELADRSSKDSKITVFGDVEEDMINRANKQGTISDVSTVCMAVCDDFQAGTTFSGFKALLSTRPFDVDFFVIDTMMHTFDPGGASCRENMLVCVTLNCETEPAIEEHSLAYDCDASANEELKEKKAIKHTLNKAEEKRSLKISALLVSGSERRAVENDVRVQGNRDAWSIFKLFGKFINGSWVESPKIDCAKLLMSYDPSGKWSNKPIVEGLDQSECLSSGRQISWYLHEERTCSHVESAVLTVISILKALLELCLDLILVSLESSDSVKHVSTWTISTKTFHLGFFLNTIVESSCRNCTSFIVQELTEPRTKSKASESSFSLFELIGGVICPINLWTTSLKSEMSTAFKTVPTLPRFCDSDMVIIFGNMVISDLCGSHIKTVHLLILTCELCVSVLLNIGGVIVPYNIECDGNLSSTRGQSTQADMTCASKMVQLAYVAYVWKVPWNLLLDKSMNDIIQMCFSGNFMTVEKFFLIDNWKDKLRCSGTNGLVYEKLRQDYFKKRKEVEAIGFIDSMLMVCFDLGSSFTETSMVKYLWKAVNSVYCCHFVEHFYNRASAQFLNLEPRSIVIITFDPGGIIFSYKTWKLVSSSILEVVLIRKLQLSDILIDELEILVFDPDGCGSVDELNSQLLFPAYLYLQGLKILICELKHIDHNLIRGRFILAWKAGMMRTVWKGSLHRLRLS